MDLEKVADETKAELPRVLAHIPGFDPTESSLIQLEDLDTLSAAQCPGFKKKARIQVLNMDSFDAAIQLDPGHNVNKHLGVTSPKANTHLKPDGAENSLDTPSTDSLAGPVADIHLSSPEPDSTSGPDETHTDSKANPDDSLDSEARNPNLLDPHRSVVVLNLASERSPGGGWQKGALAQEECLCYRSSLYLSLTPSFYPIPALAAIYTPNVVLIRSSMATGHTLLTAAQPPASLPAVSVISAAALRKPPLSDDAQTFKNPGARALTKRKIRLVLRMAALQKHTRLVLGALGCGVFANPPADVATCFLEVFNEPEFQGGWWQDVVFAVLDNVKGPGGGQHGNGNYGHFYRVLHGHEV